MKVSSKSRRNFLWIVLLTALIAIFLVTVFVFLPLRSLASKAEETKKLIKPTKDALLLQDLPKLAENLKLLGVSLGSLETEYKRLSYLKFIPFFGLYYGDGEILLRAGSDLISSANVFVQTIEPYSAKLGFKGGNPKEPIVGGQERLAGLVKVAPALSGNFGQIKEDLHSAALGLNKIGTAKYPEKLMGLELRKNLELTKSVVFYLDSSSDDIKKLVENLPTFLGEAKKVSYLILFQNDKEIRPTGGFLTAYAVFTLENGRIISVTSGDMYFLDIDNRVPFYPKAPEVIQKYLKIKDWYIRDANLSPDFKVSAQTVEEFWNRVPGVPKIDGIVSIDTHFVESLVGLLGDIQIPGYEKFTKDNITYQLELYSVVIGSKLEKRAGRKDLIGVLMQQIMQKAFSQSSKQYGQFVAKVWQEAVEKHLLIYLHSESLQSLAEKYNFAGRITDYDGDYLHVNDANFAGRKANWYIVEKVTKSLERQGGKLISTLEINYENTGDYNVDFNTGYRDYVRVFVPKGSKLLDSSGSLNGTEQLEELGKTVFSSYMAVDPKKTAKLVLKYELPDGLIKGNDYHLLIQKQPGTDHFAYEVQVGKKSEVLDLWTDTEVKLEF